MRRRCANCNAVLGPALKPLMCAACIHALQRLLHCHGAPTREESVEWLFDIYWWQWQRSGEMARWQTKVLTEYGTPRAVAA